MYKKLRFLNLMVALRPKWEFSALVELGLDRS